MSKEMEDPLNPPAGGGVSGEEVKDPLSPPVGGGASSKEVSAISRSFNRYQPFGEPLVAAQQGYNMQ